MGTPKKKFLVRFSAIYAGYRPPRPVVVEAESPGEAEIKACEIRDTDDESFRIHIYPQEA